MKLLRTKRLLMIAVLSLCCGAALPVFATGDSQKTGKPKKVATKKIAPKKAKPAVIEPFFRLLCDKKKVPISLQTSVVRYVVANGKKKTVIDLIGAIHIGDTAYYQALNKRFKGYDVVLFELVVPKKGVRIPKGGGKPSMIDMLLKDGLGLESQKKHVDYTPKNFVHADMTLDELQKAVKDRGATTMSMIMEMIQNPEAAKKKLGGKKYNLPELDLKTLLFNPQKRALSLKRVLSATLTEGEGLGGKTSVINQVIINDRNAACLKVLDQQLKKGTKKIAIFYGAAHMPDFEKQLLSKKYGMKRQGVEWVEAWDMRK